MISTDRLVSDPGVRAEVEQFLGYEAMLLDERRFREWFELLDEEYVYFIPVRTATADPADEIASTAWRVRDTKTDIKTRIARMDTGVGWSEVPPSMTMRNIGGVVVARTDREGDYEVSSALLAYRHRGTDKVGDWIPARRTDVVRLSATGPRLVSRTVIFADVVLNTPNLGIFL